MKRNKEYFFIAFRIFVILIAIGVGQVLKGLADVVNTTYDGTNYYVTFIISIIVIAILVVINVKRMNIKTTSIKIIMASICAAGIIYTISEFLYNRNMILGMITSVIFFADVFINEKTRNE